MNHLRKCKHKSDDSKVFYFHKWIDKGVRHYAASEKNDVVLSEAYALVEDIETGEVETIRVEYIQFINNDTYNTDTP